MAAVYIMHHQICQSGAVSSRYVGESEAAALRLTVFDHGGSARRNPATFDWIITNMSGQFELVPVHGAP